MSVFRSYPHEHGTKRVEGEAPIEQADPMVDYQFSDPSLAELYDAFCTLTSRGDFDFYLPLVMTAERVLDVGCGTGELLRIARERGHTGTLCGLDPADAMLEQARVRTDIEWILGDLEWVPHDQRFDLIVMSGHAFQVWIDDDELRASLATVRSLLADDGRFAFETRNPAVRAWERWIPENAVEIVTADGSRVRMAHQFEAPTSAHLVSFTTTYTSPTWNEPQVSRSTLRFLDTDSLAAFLSAAGLAIEEQFGDWDRRRLSGSSPEIITIARRAS